MESSVLRMAKKKPVVIFSKSSCCMSYSIKSLFSDLAVYPAVYELDEIPSGREIEQALARMGCNPTVPAVPTHWYESSLKTLSDDGGGGTNRMIHTYNHVFHGFSAKISALEAQKMESLPGILAVILDSGANFESDLVIGVLDTGIWQERKSFKDEDLPGTSSTSNNFF
nr:monothiol glutaredoxin-S2 [Ipomoea batatas]